MKTVRPLALGTLLFAAGVAAGMALSGSTPIATAQQDEASRYSPEVLSAYRKSRKAVGDLNDLFIASGTSTSASGGLNYFAASVGGIDAEKDLEEGRGVDPETFAALYADMVTPKIAEHLDTDAQGRLRYKKNVIRMYSRDRLKELFQRRDEMEIQSVDAE
jgi:hypothetical protein